jgi:hypothetical protein
MRVSGVIWVLGSEKQCHLHIIDFKNNCKNKKDLEYGMENYLYVRCSVIPRDEVLKGRVETSDTVNYKYMVLGMQILNTRQKVIRK